MNNTHSLLKEFIKFDKPLNEIFSDFDGLDYDTKLNNPVVITKDDVVNILERAKNDYYTAHELDDWSSDVLSFASIEIDPEYYDVICNALHFLEYGGPDYKPTKEEYEQQINLLKNAKPEVAD